MKRRYQLAIAIAVIALVLVGVRIALPSIVRDYVNDRLAALEAYGGEVADVDICLLRGAYRIDDIRIVKTGTRQPTPFFSADHLDFSVEWRNLLRGRLVAQGEFFAPQLNLVQEKTDQQSQLGREVNWVEQLEQLFPFRFNTVRVHDGTLTFRAPGIKTQDALRAQRLNAQVSNLTNVVESGKNTFASFQASATVLDTGFAQLDGKLDPLARSPTFDLNLQVRNVQLPKVNPWLRQFIKADAESGDFELYLELAAAQGKFKGYAKPVMRDVNIYSSEEPERNPLRRLWEGLVDFAANVLENEPQDQVAARIPFSGTIQHPDAGVFAALVSVLRNAFVSAFARSLEGTISVREVRHTLEDISDDSGESQEKEKQEKKGEKNGESRKSQG